MNLSTVNALFDTTKFNSFFSFHQTTERKRLVEEIIELKKYTIIRLDLTGEEILKTEQENNTFKKVLEWFLFLYNHIWKQYYPNIAFTPLVINWHKFSSCILIFRWKSKDTNQIPPSWYQKIKNINLQIDECWPLDDDEYMRQGEANDKDAEYTYQPTNKRIYERIQTMLLNKNISVRKIFNIWMKQWQARLIYKTLSDLWIFEVHPENNNEKIYYPDKYTDFTQEHITTIMNQESPVL